MVGLNGTLSVATQSLLAESGAIEITNNNIANANTPGYSRQTVLLSAQATSQSGSSVDGGVLFGGYQSVRNNVLQTTLQQQTSAGSSADTQSTALAQIEAAFSSSGSDIGSSLSNFFTSVSALSTQPTNSTSRQAVLTAAGTLTYAFHQAAATLSKAQSDANSVVADTVNQINGLTSKIAALNSQLEQMKAAGSDGGAVQDQQQQLVLQLANLTCLAQIPSGNTVTLTVGNGRPLVSGDQSFPLQVATNSDGTLRVLVSGGQDITGELSSGSLGGTLQLRDTIVPGFSVALDGLANQFATAVNTAQAGGYDANGVAGQPLFSLPAGASGSAALIAVSTSDPAQIAASSDGSPGSNGNLAGLLSLQATPLASGATPSSAYSSLVFAVGSASAEAASQASASQLAIQQTSNQIGSVSGVSVDEESANLLRFQQAYQAAAKVISTIDSLFTTVLNMSGGN